MPHFYTSDFLKRRKSHACFASIKKKNLKLNQNNIAFQNLLKNSSMRRAGLPCKGATANPDDLSSIPMTFGEGGLTLKLPSDLCMYATAHVCLCAHTHNTQMLKWKKKSTKKENKADRKWHFRLKCSWAHGDADPSPHHRISPSSSFLVMNLSLLINNYSRV